jgi:iron(III) transport system permease protein
MFFLVATVVVILLFLVALPMLFVLLQAIFPYLGEGSFRAPFSALLSIFQQGDTAVLLGNSLRLGLSVVAVSALIGIPLGALRGLFRIPLAKLWDGLFLIPFLLPPYIAALSWTLAAQPKGYLYRIAGFDLGNILFSFTGMALIMGFSAFPIVYFAVSRSMAAAGGRLADVARVCGATPWTAFVRITVPLALPAIAASLLLVFTLSIEEYGVPAALGSNIGVRMLTTSIENKLADWPVDLSGAAMLSVILVALALTAYTVQRAMLAGKSFETTTGKPVQSALRNLGFWQLPVMALFCIIAFLTVVAPLASMGLASLGRTVSGGLAWSNFTLANYGVLFTSGSESLQSLITSTSLAFGASILAGGVGFLAAWCVTSQKVRGAVLIDALSLLPVTLPGVVVGVGLILAWNQPFWPVTIYGTWGILLLSYTCLLLPYPVRYVSAALSQIGKNLEASARVHGATTLRTLWHITLPLAAPSLIAAMLMVFAIASRELVTSLLLAPAGVSTVSIFVWRQFEQGTIGKGMAMAVVAVVISLTLMLLGLFMQNRWQQRAH